MVLIATAVFAILTILGPQIGDVFSRIISGLASMPGGGELLNVGSALAQGPILGNIGGARQKSLDVIFFRESFANRAFPQVEKRCLPNIGKGNPMLRKWLRGQGLTEFAIVLPVLLATMFLVVETGRIFQAYVTVQNAAREAARYAVTGQGGEDRVTNIKQAAKDILGAGLPLMEDFRCPNYCCGNPDDPTDPNLSLPEFYCIRVWSATGYDNAGSPGERVQVEVSYNASIITPILSAAVGGVPVRGRIEMINEPFGPTAFGQAGVVPPTLSVPDTPTPTNTPVPIAISEPLYPGDPIVAGHGDPGFDPLVQIWDWTDPETRTLIGTGQISAGGTFRIGVSPPLVAEHTIRAIGSYGWDEAVVLAEEGSGSITVQKNGGDGFDPLEWTFKVLYSDGTTYIVPNGGGTLSDLPLGKYYITEIGPADWHLEDVSGADCVRVGNSAEVVLTSDGHSVGCTFTNALDTGSLTVLKSPENGALPTDWFFTVEGPDGLEGTFNSGDTLVGLPMGPYTVTESTVEGWYLKSVQGCYQFGENSALTSLAMHDHSVTCTFTNAPYAPSISIEKSTNGADADEPPGPYVEIGAGITWEYVVKNTGDFTLTSVTVTDTQDVDITCPKTTLVDNELMTCSASAVAATGQYENVGTASGEYEGIEVSDTDSSHYFGAEPAEGMRVNCGDDTDYVDGDGKIWEVDPPYTSGYWGYLGDVSRTSNGPCSTLNDLYNSYDSGQFFGFQFDNFIPGIYRITLYMVEPQLSVPGSRIFSAAIEDEPWLEMENFDIIGECGVDTCGVCSRAKTMAVSDGQLNIDLSGATISDEAILSAILIEFLEFLPPPTPTPTPTLTPTPAFTPLPTPALPPDLTITDLAVPAGEPVAAWTPVAITTDVLNDSTGACTEFFWTDLYVYTDTLSAPQIGKAGLEWQGMSGLDPHIETTLVFTHTFKNDGTHYLYTQADSFQFVNESDESNNVSQPVTVTVFYDGPPPTLTPTPVISCDAQILGTVWAFVGGQLVVPSGRVDMSLYDQNSNLIAIEQAADNGGYLFDCVPIGEEYTVMGLVEIGGILYIGSESGIDVLEEGQVLAGVDIILYPLY